MKQTSRENLLFVTGVLEGLSWLIRDDGAANALDNVREQIEEVLKNEIEECTHGEADTEP